VLRPTRKDYRRLGLSRAGFVVAVIGLLLAACSSSGKPGSGSSGGSGGVGHSGGAGGSGGIGGRGRADAGLTDAASGGAGGTSSLDGTSGGAGGASTAADDVCRSVLGALCDRAAICSGDTSGDPANRGPFCNDVAAICPDYFFNPSSTRTVAAVSGCLTDVMALSCTDLDLSLRPACWTPGTLPTGAACARASSCQSGMCSGNNYSRCGSCTGTMVATGASCAGNTLCPPGDFCHPVTKLCTPGSTVVHAGLGKACDPTGVPPVGCTGDLHCLASDGGSAGTCEPLPAKIVVGNGQTCDAVHTCGPGLICFTILGETVDGSAIPSTCTPTNPCGTQLCDDTSFCATGDGGQHCAPTSPAGTPCRNDAGHSLTTCRPGLYCANTNVCTGPGTEGAACDANTICAEYLLCVGGRCQLLSTAICAATADGSAG
jgi:hypothetical protein